MGVKYHLLTEKALEYKTLPKKATEPVLETEETIEFHLFPWYYIERKEPVNKCSFCGKPKYNPCIHESQVKFCK